MAASNSKKPAAKPAAKGTKPTPKAQPKGTPAKGASGKAAPAEQANPQRGHRARFGRKEK